MVFPPGPFQTPVGSFIQPVKPPTAPLSQGPFLYIPINCAWAPLIAGALQQLWLPSTWDADPDVVLDIQGQVTQLISTVSCATGLTAADICGLMGAEGEDCMGCCLRYQDGVLQQLSCGVWEDVPGQVPAAGDAPTTQPAGGSPQPASGGGCQTYAGLVIGNQQWLIPPSVSDGDTIQLVDAAGATNASLVTWYCSDGRLYLAGDCLPVYGHDATCQLPSAPIGTLLLHIGADYIDLGTLGTVTLAGGYSNLQATLEINTPAGNVVSGQLGVRVIVCNNQLAPWTSVFDFTVNPYSSLLTVTWGQWTAGVGYNQSLQSAPTYQACAFQLNATGVDLTNMAAIASASGETGPNAAIAFYTGAGYYGGNQQPLSGSNFPMSAVGAATLDGPGWQCATGDPVGTCSIARLTIQGTGLKPAGWP